MKRIAMALLVLSLSVPLWAQGRSWQLSPEDQRRFDSYYSRWQEYRQKNDRQQVVSMERRMLDIYAHYRIADDTPYWRVASNGRAPREQWRGRLSRSDQDRFDSYFSRWGEYRRANDREQVEGMEKRLQDIYAHYQIPSDTPYFWVASNARDEDGDRSERNRWRGRLSNEDQGRFDSCYTRWREYREGEDRDGAFRMEHRMREIMDRYDIPPEVGYEQVASPRAEDD
jgi:hypothetical protein